MNKLFEVVEISDGCGGFYYTMEPIEGEFLTKEEQDYKENMNEAVDNTLLPDIHSDEEVR